MEVVLIVVFLSACMFAVLGGWIACQKNRDPGEGAFLGFLFGPFGCLIEAVLPSLAAARPAAARVTPPAETAALLAAARVRRVVSSRPGRRTPAEREWREAETRLWNAEREKARKERLEEENRRLAEQREWRNRMLWRFGWYKALPETLQPIVLGLAVAAPVVAAIILNSPAPLRGGFFSDLAIGQNRRAASGLVILPPLLTRHPLSGAVRSKPADHRQARRSKTGHVRPPTKRPTGRRSGSERRPGERPTGE